MKHYSIIALAFIAAISLLFSCSKEKDVIVPDTVQEQITISASFPEDGLTKVGFIEEGYNNKLNLVWQAGDQITITDESDPSNTQTFDIASGVGEKSATFTGTPLAAAASYKVVYDGNPSYAEQTQAADGDTGHLKYVATLTGVTDYSSFTFTAAASSAVLRLRTSIPDDLYGNIKAVDIKMGTVSVKVNVTNSADVGEVNVFTVYASLPGQTEISAGTDLLVSFQMDDVKAYDKYTAYRQLSAMTVKAGKVNTLSLNCTGIKTSAGYADDGTAAHPYLIADQHQMQAISLTTTKKYYKMVDDVDMTGITWAPLNSADPYTNQIDFNGNNKTISNLKSTGKYASFTGVLYGSIYNVTFDKADINTTGKNAGVVAAFCGTGTDDIKGDIHDITVKGSTLKSTNTYFGGIVGQIANPCADIDNCKVINTTITGGGSYTGAIIGAMMSAAYNVTNCSASDVTITATGIQHVGGLIGRITTACTVEKCSFSGSVTGGHDVGGIVGSTANVATVISNCYTAGSVNGGDGYQRCGGIVGELGTGGSVTLCYSTASVSSARVCGGIVARACSAGWTTTAASGNTISKCIAFNPSVLASSNGTFGSSGSIVGYTSCKNILSDCYRLYNMAYSNSNNESEYTDTMVDQPDCDGTNWTLGTTVGTKATYQCPYYGVAAAADKTVSAIAQELGWSDAIWDFSDNLPKLK